MGINDYGWGGGRNQVMGGNISASARPGDLEGPVEVDPVAGHAALARFATAYAGTHGKIRAAAPSAEVW